MRWAVPLTQASLEHLRVIFKAVPHPGDPAESSTRPLEPQSNTAAKIITFFRFSLKRNTQVLFTHAIPDIIREGSGLTLLHAFGGQSYRYHFTLSLKNCFINWPEKAV